MQKGQKVSTEQVVRHKAKLHKNFIAQLNPQPWQEYFNTLLSHNNTKQSKLSLTLKEYFELISGGKSSKDVIKLGYNKHLVFFYNKLLKNEITVTKEDFEKDYLAGMTLNKIGKKNNICRENITFLRELFGIKRKGAKYINRKLTEEPLTALQKELIYGGLMGDGKKASSSSFSVKHSVKAKDYVLWKYAILENVASKASLKTEYAYDERYNTTNGSTIFYTHANSDIEVIIKQFYGTGKKVITKEILNYVTDFGLAVWYMDDGDIDWNYRSRKRGWNTAPSVKLCTDSFSYDEHLIMQKWFKNKYDIESIIRRKSRNSVQHRMRFNSINTKKFLDIVRPHIIPYMRYKCDYNAYLLRRKTLGLEYENTVLKVSDCPVGPSFDELPINQQEEWVSVIFHAARNRKILPTLTVDSRKKFLNALKTFDTSRLVEGNVIKYWGYPSSFMQFFHPHIYDMKNKGSMSIMEIFDDNHMLKDIIRQVIIKGKQPTIAALRRRMSRYRGNRSVSIFPPYGAKAVYDYYCLNNATVVDFCSGFGSRMLGAWASKNVRTYIGCEPIAKSYVGLTKLITEINCHFGASELLIRNCTAQDLLPTCNDNSVDLVFTSPPYFDTEIYSDDQSQSRVAYGSYSDWLNNWLVVCIKQSMRILKSGGKLILNVANCSPYNIADNVLDFAQNHYAVEIGRIFISHNTHEPLLVVTKV